MKTFELGELVVTYRKSAVMFNIKNKDGFEPYRNSRFKDEDESYFNDKDLICEVELNGEQLVCFYKKMKEIALECWANFNPKVADSLGSDYSENYLKEFDNEASLGFKGDRLIVDGYFQPMHKKELILLYKFNKRKFESFIFDLEKKVNGNE